MCNSDNKHQTTNTSLSSVDNELHNIVTAECFDTNIDNGLFVRTNEIDLNEIPINALQLKSQNILSNSLNPQKIFNNPENGFFRDWRGVLQCALPKSNVSDISAKQDQMKEVLNIWYKEDKENATLGRLQSILLTIDRSDALDDIDNFAEDCKEYWRMKQMKCSNPSKINTAEKYDALVLFVKEDTDFGNEIIIELEQRGLKIFDPDRDMLGGEHVNETLRQRITRDCRHLIVIFSNDFFDSPANKFLTSYALWKGVTETKRLIVPCIRTPCSIPDPWDSYRILAYYKQSSLINFWDKLFKSVAKRSIDLLPETNETAKMKTAITIETVKSFASAKPKPKTIENVLTKQENETVSLIKSSSIDRLLSNSPEIVSDEPCSSTISKMSVKKTKIWLPKFRKFSKNRTAVKDTTNE